MVVGFVGLTVAPLVGHDADACVVQQAINCRVELKVGKVK